MNRSPIPFLCRLGFHNWLVVSVPTSIFAPAVKQCSRCQRRRGFLGSKPSTESLRDRNLRLEQESEQAIMPMTADELYDNFASLGPQELHVLFHYLADHLYQARLSRGQRLCDNTDFKEWLRELGDVALVRSRKRLGKAAEQGRR